MKKDVRVPAATRKPNTAARMSHMVAIAISVLKLPYCAAAKLAVARAVMARTRLMQRRIRATSPMILKLVLQLRRA